MSNLQMFKLVLSLVAILQATGLIEINKLFISLNQTIQMLLIIKFSVTLIMIIAMQHGLEIRSLKIQYRIKTEQKIYLLPNQNH
jgi:hypothetical protein